MAGERVIEEGLWVAYVGATTMSAKKYEVELDERVAENLEAVARETARIPPAALIALLVVKALAPWHRLAKEVDHDGQD